MARPRANWSKRRDDSRYVFSFVVLVGGGGV